MWGALAEAVKLANILTIRETLIGNETIHRGLAGHRFLLV